MRLGMRALTPRIARCCAHHHEYPREDSNLHYSTFVAWWSVQLTDAGIECRRRDSNPRSCEASRLQRGDVPLVVFGVRARGGSRTRVTGLASRRMAALLHVHGGGR